MDEFGINNRIVQIMHDAGLSKNAFGKALGVSQTAIAQIELNKNFPSFKVIIEVLKQYPNISSDWLLLGKGPKERCSNMKQNEVNEPIATYTADSGLLREALHAVNAKSTETEKLIDVVKSQMEEMVRYGTRFDRILSLMDKLYGVKFIEPKND